MTLEDLIGIPWRAGGRDTDGCDCVGLALLVQQELWGRKFPFPHQYDPESDVVLEERLFRWLHKIARPVINPAPGRLVVMQMTVGGHRFLHLGTLLDGAPLRMLHTYPGHRSQAVRFHGRYLARVRGYFDGEEGERCRTQR